MKQLNKERSKTMMVEKEEDRVSSLPDDVLSHILSFVELREAVKTSILSKRWEKVWISIHRINLNNQSCRGGFNRDLSTIEEKKLRSSFNNFVNGILTGKNNNRTPYVTSFSLWYSFGSEGRTLCEETPYLIQWIAAAISPNLQNFEFGIGVDYLYQSIIFKMPPNLFQCQNLVTLNLNSFYDSDMIRFDVPETVSLPSLEKLSLVKVKFKNKDSLKNILLGCPVLEELYMKHVEHGDYRSVKQNLFVFSPSLKILRVENQSYYNVLGNCYVVEAPKLEYLHFGEHSLTDFTITVSTSSLVSAVIDFGTYVHDRSSPFSVIEVFQGISDIQNLELWTNNTIMLKDELANLPEFHNFIHLKIGCCKNRDIIPCILPHSPQLKHLIFDASLLNSKEGFMWSTPQRVLNCLTLYLETIEIGSFWRNKKEALKMIQYLLDNAKVLKKMVITPIRNYKKVLDKLLLSDARLCVTKK